MILSFLVNWGWTMPHQGFNNMHCIELTLSAKERVKNHVMFSIN
jgi:hypothetical protein